MLIGMRTIKFQVLSIHGRSRQDEADNDIPDPSQMHVRWYRPAGIMTIRNSVVSTLNTTSLHHFHLSKNPYLIAACIYIR